MTRVREITLMLLTAAIILFAGQNLQAVDVQFLFWDFQVPLALITLVPLLAGLVIGIAGTAIRLGRRRRAAEAKKEADSPLEGAAGSEPPGDEASEDT